VDVPEKVESCTFGRAVTNVSSRGYSPLQCTTPQSEHQKKNAGIKRRRVGMKKGRTEGKLKGGKGGVHGFRRVGRCVLLERRAQTNRHRSSVSRAQFKRGEAGVARRACVRKGFAMRTRRGERASEGKGKSPIPPPWHQAKAIAFWRIPIYRKKGRYLKDCRSVGKL